jgi:hypothetical protein
MIADTPTISTGENLSYSMNTSMATPAGASAQATKPAGRH